MHDGMESYEGNFDTTIEGIIPGISDHRLERYISAIKQQIFSYPGVDTALNISTYESITYENVYEGPRDKGIGYDVSHSDDDGLVSYYNKITFHKLV